MIERFLKTILDVPEHLIALALVAAGSCIALTHLPHAFEVGSALTSSGLAMYRGVKQ